MSTDTPDPNAARRDSILQAAADVFLRYGYKKTSMDDLARAAGLSRQGLYLHFANKDVLFKDAVTRLIQQGLAAARAALGREDLGVEERLLGAFMALKSHSDGGAMSQEHMVELLATAAQLVGPVLDELEQTLSADLARVLQAGGVVARWQDAGFTARELAQHLQAASYGAKHQAKTPADYKKRMTIAVRLVCRTQAAPP